MEARVAQERAAMRAKEAIAHVKKQHLQEAEKPFFTQITETFAADDEAIWSEIDLLESDPAHRGIAMRNLRFKAETLEWEGLWAKDVFKKWNRSDLLPDNKVFTSRYVYKIKRSSKTGAAYRFKARLILRGFEMEKGVDYVDNFSPTPGLAVARTRSQLLLLMTSSSTLST
jgi:hypothetical protein